LQGLAGAKPNDAIVERFAAILMLVPDTADYVQAAEIRDKYATNTREIREKYAIRVDAKACKLGQSMPSLRN